MPPRRKKVKSWTEILQGVAWPLAQMAGLVLFAWINATHFDQTEIKMLAEYAAYWKLVDMVRTKLS